MNTLEYFIWIEVKATEQDSTRSFKVSSEQQLDPHDVDGDRLMVIGDGYVEIENGRDVGALTVAVASDEANNGAGRFDPWKRERLLGVGADIVIPDYQDAAVLLDVIEGK